VVWPSVKYAEMQAKMELAAKIVIYAMYHAISMDAAKEIVIVVDVIVEDVI